jgi:heptose I phosphotransferase
MFHTEHMRTDPAYRERLQTCGLDTVGRVLTRTDGRIVAWSRSTDTLFVPGAAETPGFYVKRYYFSRWNSRLRGTFRGTFFGMHRGQAEYAALNTMRELGIPAVRAVAYGERRAAHFLSACFLITEEVPGAQNLTAFALQTADGRLRLTPVQRHLLIRALATQLAALHAAGLSHGNLFWRNLLVRDGPDSRPEFFFVDAHPLHAWERLGAGVNWWWSELAQVAVSALPFTTRAERVRFVRHYCECARLSPALKTHMRQIEQLAQEWRRHEERRIRMTRLFAEWNWQLADEERRRSAASAGGMAESAT